MFEGLTRQKEAEETHKLLKMVRMEFKNSLRQVFFLEQFETGAHQIGSCLRAMQVTAKITTPSNGVG